MNNHRSPKQKPTASPTKRRDRPSRIVGLAAIATSLGFVVFGILSMITGAESFVVKYGNRDLHRHGIETKHQHHHHQEYYTTSSFLAPMLTFYGRYSSSKLLLSSSSLSSSSKDSKFSSASSPPTNAHSANASTDSASASASIKATFSNTTIASKNDVASFDSSTTTGTGTGNRSKKEERKRYDAELEEAFAQQTRERNPLLGVKSIGVDYGLVRTGVAVTIGYNPEALEVIVTDHPLLKEDEAEGMSEEEVEKEEELRLEVQRAKVAERVVELALRENTDMIVIGLPLHKNGTEAPQTALTRKFACDHLAIAALRTLGPGVSVYMCDERYTSKEAAARMRSSQPSRNHNSNNDLYGLLDAESAKIILEQFYDDRLDRYNIRDSDSDSEANTKNVDPGYNGELVTIPDADLVKELTLEYNEKRRLEREQLATKRNDREANVKWRKVAMEQDRIRAKEKEEENAANGIVASKKKKKKKKKNRK